jgi:hypothetical protein
MDAAKELKRRPLNYAEIADIDLVIDENIGVMDVPACRTTKGGRVNENTLITAVNGGTILRQLTSTQVQRMRSQAVGLSKIFQRQTFRLSTIKKMLNRSLSILKSMLLSLEAFLQVLCEYVPKSFREELLQLVMTSTARLLFQMLLSLLLVL